MSDVKFIVDADTAKAAAAFIRLVEAQRKVHDGLSDIHKKSTEAEGSLTKLGESVKDGVVDSLKEFGAGIATLAGLKETLAGIAENYSKISEANVGFQHDVTPLLAMGDNIQGFGRVEDDVLSLSVAYGQIPQATAAAMASVQQMMQNASPDQQREMLNETHELTEVIGGDLATNLQVAGKLWQAYGEKAGGAGKITATIMEMVRSGLPRDELDMVARVTPAAVEAGFRPDQVAATVASTSQWGGSDARMIRGMEGVLSKFEAIKQKAEEKLGLKLEGDPLEQLKQIAKFADQNPDVIAQVFPKNEGVWLKEFAAHLDDIQKKLEKFKDLKGDEVSKTLTNRLTDPSFFSASIAEKIKVATENTDVIKGRDPANLELKEKYDLATLGEKLTSKPWQTEEMQKTAVTAEMVGGGTTLQYAGVTELVNDIELAAGKAQSREEKNRLTAQAEGLKIKYGATFNNYIAREKVGDDWVVRDDGTVNTGEFTSPNFTGPQDAKQFFELRKQGFDLNAGTYDEYQRLLKNDPKAGAGYLTQHKTKEKLPTGEGGEGSGDSADRLSAAADKLAASIEKLTSSHSHIQKAMFEAITGARNLKNSSEN